MIVRAFEIACLPALLAWAFLGAGAALVVWLGAFGICCGAWALWSVLSH